MKIIRALFAGTIFFAGLSVLTGPATAVFARQSSEAARAGSGVPAQEQTSPSNTKAIEPAQRETGAVTQLTDRQKKLMADTDKLLALATELKQKVDKTNKDVLSVDVVKKAEEIEKLAHSLKAEMK